MKERKSRDREIEAIMSDLKWYEQMTWNQNVPQRLVDIFQEARRAIEEKEGVRMGGEKRFWYRRGFIGNGKEYPHHTVGSDSSGERVDVWYPSDYQRQLAQLQSNEQFGAVSITEMWLSYSHRSSGADDGGEISSTVGFIVPVRQDGENPNLYKSIEWFVGRGRLFKRSLDGRWGQAGKDDGSMDELEKRMKLIIEKGHYRYVGQMLMDEGEQQRRSESVHINTGKEGLYASEGLEVPMPTQAQIEEHWMKSPEYLQAFPWHRDMHDETVGEFGGRG